ncbi:MAG: hypothetical protein KKG09_05525 [Verrucomicrobia bacterium]|nr:hypothetical protein [Verrucomicrobiota bacterium]MCG2681645.1 hypothetical protein [Kiritimatiellia bacterium]MBU4248097.1 hypothetical protein [Verrucomicrobiota bacterium]MBU4290773.1 hypothetical protein [Verrucomicrobiota bacterium]MBU4429752.1 hypothetical protein [Verrucomicrobiota bacterium]
MDALLAGDLTGEERRPVRCHIGACRKCREEYRLLKAVVQSMADLPLFEPSAHFNANVLFRLGMEPSSVSTQFPVWAKWLVSGLLVLSWLWVMFLAFAVRTEFMMLNASRFMLWIKIEAHVFISMFMNTAETLGIVAGLLLQECMAILNPLLLFQILVALVIAPVIVIVSINGMHLRAKAQGGMLC